MTLSSVAMGICVAVWAACLTLSFLPLPVAPDPSVNLVLMALAGGIVAISQRGKERQ